MGPWHFYLTLFQIVPNNFCLYSSCMLIRANLYKSLHAYDMVWDQVIKFDSKYRNFKEAIYDANLAWLALSPSHRTIIKWKNTTEIVFRSSSMYIYGPKAAGREKSALRVTKQPSLWETSWPNAWSQQLALLDSWQSLWCQYAQDFSPSWSHF